MFEIFRIKYFGIQPVAKVKSKTIERIIRRDYGGNFHEVKRKLESVRSDAPGGLNRLSAAVLKLANGHVSKIDSLIKKCNLDFRDVVSEAEYPRFFKLASSKIESREARAIYLSDWIDYTRWLNKK